jgi:alpha-glucosidase
VWWREGVLYQIYPRSFADADGDGVGDLPGIRARLDYLEWLGVDGIWLTPVHPSPNADWGYDVADYTGVHPELGTLSDLEELIADAGERGIRVLLDLVPNHTSDRHPWFADPAKRAWYVWADAPPNNWVSVFGGSAWTRGEHGYYLHNFLPQQPDLNWWNEEVRQAFDEILRFWFDRGVAGFRIDVAHGLVKDRQLRDNTIAGTDAPEGLRRIGQLMDRSMNQPEVHDIFKRWRRIADEYEPKRVLVGETYVHDVERMAAYYGSGDDELHLAFNFAFVHAPFEAGALREVVEATEAALPLDAWPVWTGSNHDVVRFPTRWCKDDDALGRCALVALLTLRGTPVLYYGDELLLASAAEAGGRDVAGRDPSRTPMPWADGDWVDPWLPVGTQTTVAEQREDPGSPLRLVRDLIALRRRRDDLRTGAYASLPAPGGVWAWRRGEATAVALNLSRRAVDLDLGGELVLGTNGANATRLPPRSAAILAFR